MVFSRTNLRVRKSELMVAMAANVVRAKATLNKTESGRRNRTLVRIGREEEERQMEHARTNEQAEAPWPNKEGKRKTAQDEEQGQPTRLRRDVRLQVFDGQSARELDHNQKQENDIPVEMALVGNQGWDVVHRPRPQDHPPAMEKPQPLDTGMPSYNGDLTMGNRNGEGVEDHRSEGQKRRYTDEDLEQATFE